MGTLAIKTSPYLNIVLLGHVAPTRGVQERIEPHGDDVPEYLGLDELPVQETVKALSAQLVKHYVH